MLPFLKPKAMSGVIIARKKADGGGIEPMHEEGEHEPGLMAAAEDLISAFHMKDAKAVADALVAAFHVADLMPHEEGPHEEE